MNASILTNKIVRTDWIAWLMSGHVFARFIAVGFLNTVFGYACFMVFICLGLHHATALLAAMVIGILFNFETYGLLVFRSGGSGSIFRFVFVYCVGYGVNILLINAMEIFGWPMYARGAISMLAVAGIMFLLLKGFVFRRAVDKRPY